MTETPLKVLLIEDNPGDARLIRELLKEGRGAGFSLETVGSLAAGLARLAEEEFDAVLLDLGLPDCQGLDTLNSIARAHPELAVVVLSGQDDEVTAVGAAQANAQDYLAKHALSSADLRRALRGAIERQRLQAALHDSERRYRELFEHINCGVAVYEVVDDGRDFIIRDFNSAGERIDHDSREQLIGKSIFEARPGIEEFGLMDVFRKVWKTGEPARFPVARYRDMRLSTWYDNYVYKLPSGEIVAVFEDVTERKRAEEALKESEEKLRLFVEHAPAALAMFDRDMRYIAVSHRWISDFHLHDIGLIGKCHYDVFPELSSELKAIHQRGMNGEVVKCDDDKFERADGSIQWLCWEMWPWKTAEGSIGGIIIFNEDITERKRAEEALAISEDKFKYIFDHSAIGKSITSPDGWINPNQALCDTLGYTAEELRKKRWQDITPSEDIDCIASKLAPLLEGKQESIRFEKRYIHKNGSIIWGDVSTSMRRDAAGKPMYFITSVVDITARKRVEEALRESERRLKEAQNMAQLGHWEWDVKTGNVEWSDEVYRIFQLDPNEFTPHIDSILALSPWPGDHERDKELIEKAIKSHEKGTYEQRFLRPDHSVGHYISTFQGKYDNEGNLVSIVGTVQDITERKRAEEALRESQRFSLATIDALSAHICVLDETGRIVTVNQAWRAFASANPPLCANIAEGANYLAVCDAATGQDAEDAAAFAAGIREVMRGEKEKFSLEYPCHSPHEKRWFIGHVTRFAGVGPTYVVVSHENITERKRAEEEREKLQAQLIQSQKMESVGRLAGGVAHDFNNMLQTILGCTELSLELAPPGSNLREFLEEVMKAAQRSADLTSQLLAFARKQTISPRVLDLNEIIEGTLRMLRRLIGENINLAWMPAKDIWTVKADSSQVDNILANLCVNARDAIAGAGKVTIETGNATFDEKYCATHPGFIPGEYVLLAVSDDGCGMDKETLAKLFEPFFTTKERGKGTGLGLATIYGIVKQNNGFINVYSEPGKGTTFRIYLPRFYAEAAETAPPPEAPHAPRGGTETVLIVEDEEAILKLGQKILEAMGYTVLTANDPKKAVELVARYPGEIHLLITDVVMPEMDGQELSRQLAKRKPQMKCLYMSGYTANVIAHRGVLDEGVLFISKPFSGATLAAKVREALEK